MPILEIGTIETFIHRRRDLLIIAGIDTSAAARDILHFPVVPMEFLHQKKKEGVKSHRNITGTDTNIYRIFA